MDLNGLGTTTSRAFVYGCFQDESTWACVEGDPERSCLASDFVVLVLSPPRRTVLSETVLVLDGCFNCADLGSTRFAVTCRPMGRIAILDRVEHEQCGAPKSPVVLSWLFGSWSPAKSLKRQRRVALRAQRSPRCCWRRVSRRARVIRSRRPPSTKKAFSRARNCWSNR